MKYGWRFSRALGFCALLLLGAAPVQAESPARTIAEGNRSYQEGDLEQALQQYQAAHEGLEDTSVADYNIGNVLYRQGDYKRALEEYRRALAAEDPELVLKARFNMGNAHYQSEEFGKAVEDFRDVLRQTPEDAAAKRNLELALRALQQQEQEQQDQQQDQEGEEQEDSEQQQQNQEGDEQDQEQQQQQEQDGEEQEQQQQDPEDSEGQESAGQPESSDQPGKLQESALSAQEAERILDALREEEKENMKKAFRAPRRGRGTGKDW